ncbi:helix-turn-helix transcriptional regulator, partial [Endobacter medicaginis]
MSRQLIGQTIARLRAERGLTQQRLAATLGISASYLNLIEHDRRAVTASLLFKLTRALDVELDMLSGERERLLMLGVREALSDPALAKDTPPPEELAALGARPALARSVI